MEIKAIRHLSLQATREFVGYGAGATFTNIDATHWEVSYNRGASHDVIAFMNGPSIDATDFIFL